jgi:hypothetical protein
MADYTLAPPPYQTLLDNAGAPVSNGCVWTYAAGTTTPIATYSDALGTPNTNPIRTDPAGRYTAYLLAGTGYKFVCETPCSPPSGHGSVLRTADNIVGTPGPPLAATPGTWTPSLGGTTTYAGREGTYVRVGRLVFARASLSITTIGTGSASTISGLPFPVTTATPIAVGYFANLATPVVWVGGWTQSGSTDLLLLALSAAGITPNTAALLGNGSVLFLSVVYETSAP